ncbi:hypothetical protein WUBG_19102, partial [Wuchereria bancrofti]
MSSETLKLLPIGAEGIVEKIIQLGATKFMQISQHVLDRMPDTVDIADIFDTEEREKLREILKIDLTNGTCYF